LVFNPPKHDAVCDRDQTPLVTREDDQEAVVRQRFSAYEQQTAPLLGYFRGSGCRFHDVDGSTGGPDGIARRIVELLNLG
jgi:adenylate kinase